MRERDGIPIVADSKDLRERGSGGRNCQQVKKTKNKKSPSLTQSSHSSCQNPFRVLTAIS